MKTSPISNRWGRSGITGSQTHRPPVRRLRTLAALAGVLVLAACSPDNDVLVDSSADHFSAPAPPEPIAGVYSLYPREKRIAELPDDEAEVILAPLGKGMLHIVAECKGQGQIQVSWEKGSSAGGLCSTDGISTGFRIVLPHGLKRPRIAIEKGNADQRVRALVGWSDRVPKRPKWARKQGDLRA